MDDEADAGFLGNRADRLQERMVVGAQLLRVDALIRSDRGEELRGGEAFLAARKAGDDGAFEAAALVVVSAAKRRPAASTVSGG